MNNLKPGDIILYKGSRWLSRAIRYFMNKYRKKLGLPNRELFSHAAMVISIWGKLYVAEAIGNGITIRPYDVTYANKKNKIKILTPKKAYTKKEQDNISTIAVAYALEPTRYDFFNFLFQIDMIRKQTKYSDKKWAGPVGKKAEKRLYCTEAVATWANKVRPNTFDKPWTVNPVDVDINKYYKVLYNGITKQGS